ncbi:Tfp pilus assembly protein FimV [Moraxella lacunata]|uniref:Tfp pilus assembly protein FimV n=1 Tax=Moraxella lacunata TaxID=477 RepID=A0A378T8C9_MORLA|nr:FimV/HubP family polar landmark protein [Moraxella lacunata]STZ55786.1 Tfp pilus assembly protein FimV [Moraxella lacunata]
MSWHKTHRTTFIYQAVLASLFGMVSLNASAMNLGQANITSAQHEPLSATINVTNIDAANFHASVASNDIYRQMGLSPDAQISVSFTPTSNNAGQITLTSNQPISTPFADVVLNLNNNGEQIIEPQTLLMPLPAANAFTLPEDKVTQVVTAETRPNLPETSPTTKTPDDTMSLDEPVTQVITQDTPVLEPVPTAVGTSEGNIISKEETVLSQITPEGTNRQVDILTEEIVRRVYPAGQVPPTPTNPTFDEPFIAQDTTPEQVSQPKQGQVATPTESQSSQAIYVVQQGDSLWNIANVIAQANNMNVNEVMAAIHETNPDAFNKGNINQLKTNANLNLPNYQVIPSQKAIAEAIEARRASKERAVTARQPTSRSNTARQTRKETPKRSSQVTAKPAQKALPKAQMTLVTPTQQGSATGTNNKHSSNTAAGGGNLAGTLKNTRQQTASNAKRVNSLNEELSSAARKVQLQNQKLAELESRLKSLKEKK